MIGRQPNPYRPGFNQAPTELAGREPVLAAAREALDIAALDARTPRPLVLVGSRGVGKTVVLGEIAAIAAETYSWLTVAIEIRPSTPFTAPLVQRLQTARDLFDQVEPGRGLEVTEAKVRANVFGLGGEVTVTKDQTGHHPPLPLDAALSATCAAALTRKSGLVLTIDELQLAKREELADLAATLQEHVPDGWPLVVAVAGLPTIRDPQRSVTYLERGEWHELGLLDYSDTLQALTAPAKAAGRPFTADGAPPLAEASGGYPYAIQVLGHHAWRASTGSDQITTEHSARADTAGQQDLAAGLYAARWHDASPKEREYLQTLARLTTSLGDVTGGDIAAHLVRPPSAVSYLRDRLLKKGTLFTDGRYLRFPIPGMATWITSQDFVQEP